MTERVKISGFGRPGFIKDTAEYDVTPEAWDEVRNVRFTPQGAEVFGGESLVMSEAPIVPHWLKVFPPVETPIWVYGNETKMYAFDGDHTEITRTSGGDYAGDATQRWQGEVFNGVGVFNNTRDIPQYWPNFSSGTRLQNLPNWPSAVRARFLRPFKYFLIAGYITDTGVEYPYRIRWSHSADPGSIPDSWALNDPTKDSGEFDLASTSDYVVDGLELGDGFIVYKQKRAHYLYLSGDEQIFKEIPIIQGRGLLWRDCVQSFPGGHFVAGIDDLYVHTGQRGSDTSLVEARLRNWIFNQIDASNYFNCFTVDYSRRNEYWFCFPEAGEVYPTLAVVWNRITNGIGIRELRKNPFIYSGPVQNIADDNIWGDDEAVFETFRYVAEDGNFYLSETGDIFVQE
jgi:hypothetical protein